MIFAVLLSAALSAPGGAQPPSPAEPSLSTAAVAAAAKPKHALIPGDEVELKAIDGWSLKAIWNRAEAGQPTIILLHGTGQRKEEWRPLARVLDKKGIGYLAVDLRGHGESRTTPTGETITWKKLRSGRDANDFEDMTRDVEAGVAYLAGQGVAEETIGLIGAEVGGSIAIKYAAIHPKVPWVIMLSPGLRWNEVLTVNALRAFKGRATPILMVYSDADKRSSKETPLMFAFAKNSIGEGKAAQIVVPEERGTRMLSSSADKGLRDQILAWIANPASFGPAVSTTTVVGASTAPALGISVDTATAVSTGTVVRVSSPTEEGMDDPLPAPTPLNE
jgi:pimeloyl-ACP methyl ester carboxylesterase